MFGVKARHAVLALILSPGRPMLLLIGQAALWVVVAAAFMSAADYFRRFNTVLSPKVVDFPPATSSAPRSPRVTPRPAPTQSAAPTSILRS